MIVQDIPRAWTCASQSPTCGLLSTRVSTAERTNQEKVVILVPHRQGSADAQTETRPNRSGGQLEKATSMSMKTAHKDNREEPDMNSCK